MTVAFSILGPAEESSPQGHKRNGHDSQHEEMIHYSEQARTIQHDRPGGGQQVSEWKQLRRPLNDWKAPLE